MQQESNTRYLGRWWQGGLRERKLLQHYLIMHLVMYSNLFLLACFMGMGLAMGLGDRGAVRNNSKLISWALFSELHTSCITT